MKYNVIDVMDGMAYAPGEEVIAVVEADSAGAAIAAVMAQIGFTDAVIAQDPDGYAKHILPMVAAIPAAYPLDRLSSYLGLDTSSGNRCLSPIVPRRRALDRGQTERSNG